MNQVVTEAVNQGEYQVVNQIVNQDWIGKLSDQPRGKRHQVVNQDSVDLETKLGDVLGSDLKSKLLES